MLQLSFKQFHPSSLIVTAHHCTRYIASAHLSYLLHLSNLSDSLLSTLLMSATYTSNSFILFRIHICMPSLNASNAKCIHS